MFAAALFNVFTLVICCLGTAQAVVDAALADRRRIRIGSGIIATVSLLGVVASMARTAALVLA